MNDYVYLDDANMSWSEFGQWDKLEDINSDGLYIDGHEIMGYSCSMHMAFNEKVDGSIDL